MGFGSSDILKYFRRAFALLVRPGGQMCKGNNNYHLGTFNRFQNDITLEQPQGLHFGRPLSGQMGPWAAPPLNLYQPAIPSVLCLIAGISA
jgi:hypothetical protein